MTGSLTFPYFYSPIAYYEGRVLKCKGIATEGNAPFVMAEHPGTIILGGYRGDRIHADDYRAFKD